MKIYKNKEFKHYECHGEMLHKKYFLGISQINIKIYAAKELNIKGG